MRKVLDQIKSDFVKHCMMIRERKNQPCSKHFQQDDKIYQILAQTAWITLTGLPG